MKVKFPRELWSSWLEVMAPLAKEELLRKYETGQLTEQEVFLQDALADSDDLFEDHLSDDLKTMIVMPLVAFSEGYKAGKPEAKKRFEFKSILESKEDEDLKRNLLRKLVHPARRVGILHRLDNPPVEKSDKKKKGKAEEDIKSAFYGRKDKL